MKQINIFFIILTISFIIIGNLYAKSREVYLLPSKPYEQGKIIPTNDKLSLDLLIQYDGGESEYYLSGFWTGDTLGIYFEPPAACSLVEVHFCVYNPCQDTGEYYAMVGRAAYDVTTNDEYHWWESIPGPTPFDTIYTDSLMETEIIGTWDWDTLVVSDMPDIGTDAFIGAAAPMDTTFTIRIDASVDPLYHAIRNWWGPNGYGWCTSYHLFWIRALVRVYENIRPSIIMDKLDGTYDTGNRLVKIYTEDFDPDTSTLGIDEIKLYYHINDSYVWLEADVIQDSVQYPTPGWEYAWWYAEMPGQPAETKVTYWVEGIDKGGMDCITSEHWYKVKAGTADYGLLYVEGDDWFGPGTGVYNAFAGQPFDVWNEIFDNIRTIYWVDTTVIEFYASGPGGRSFSWLSFSGFDLACFTYTQTFRDFMDNGGCLFLGGQDIPGCGYGLGYGEWEAPPSPHPLRDYLKAYAGDDDYIFSSPFTVFVDTTDVVALGMPEEVTIDCATALQSTWVGIFEELDSLCVPLFFDDEGNILGYRYEDQELEFKVVFLYFPFHAITDTNAQDIFIENITNWFGVGVEEEPLEFIYNLPMVTPNPLSNSATINFTIIKNEHVSIKVYNITGSLVSKLVDENLNSGTHYLIIDTDNLSSGVYFLKMNTGNFCHTAKFLVLK